WCQDEEVLGELTMSGRGTCHPCEFVEFDACRHPCALTPVECWRAGGAWGGSADRQELVIRDNRARHVRVCGRLVSLPHPTGGAGRSDRVVRIADIGVGQRGVTRGVPSVDIRERDEMLRKCRVCFGGIGRGKLLDLETVTER